MTSPWVIMGDFNAILDDQYRQGGSSHLSTIGRRAFHETVEWCGLLDGGHEGPKFIWQRGNLQERLDRVLMNEAWRLRFPRAKVSHLFFYK